MAESEKSNKRRASSNVERSDASVNEPQIESPRRRPLSGWPMIIGWLAMLIFTIHACTQMMHAGDTWIGMACGRHFVNHGVDTVEPFSANSLEAGPTEAEITAWPSWARWITDQVGIETVERWHPTGWINQNWLTHVIFYSLVPQSSYADDLNFSSNALVYWKFAIYMMTVVCVYFTGRLLRANPALCTVFSCFAMFAGRSFLSIRPADFSNMLVAVFLLILMLATYRNVLFIWLVVPITVFWCNVHGGYIYTFIMLAAFIGLNLPTGIHKKNAFVAATVGYVLVLICCAMIIKISVGLIFLMVFAYAVLASILRLIRGRFVSLDARGICHTVAAAITAFIATIIFNPFHLTNLTHIYAISVSEHADRWRNINEWRGVFDKSVICGTMTPFFTMSLIGLAALVLWGVTQTVGPRWVDRQRKRKTGAPGDYEWPQINLAIIVIAALTILMAIRSRRFIPIAAIAACPVIAMLIDQAIRALSAMRNFQRRNRLVVSAMPHHLLLGLIIAGGIAVIFFGAWCGFRFKEAYLDPWPNEPNPKLGSVFMRMTNSDTKPFYAMKFIKDNKLEGHIFNYWGDGGFIAWGQEPDPSTGRTPLQLFIDGRAQAAYDRKAFDAWKYIKHGGGVADQILARIRATGGGLTKEDYKTIGDWMNAQFKAKENDVWIILMPSIVFDSSSNKGFLYHAMRALENHPEWRLAFLNNQQKLLVDITTPQGKRLCDGIFTGDTVYPDEFHRNLICAHTWYLYASGAAEEREGFEFAKTAFELNPSTAPLYEVISYSVFPQLKAEVDEFCRAYLDEFEASRGAWSRQAGYRFKIQTARVACTYLKDPAKQEQYLGELRRIDESMRW